MTKNTIGGKKTKSLLVVKMVFLVLMIIIYLAPFLLVFINSFKQKTTVVKNPLLLVDPDGLNLNNYIKAFSQMKFPLALVNSLIVTITSVAIIILFSAMAAYVFVRTNYLACKISFSLMLAAMVIPFQSIMIPLVSIYGSTFNVLNYKATLIFMNIGFGVGLATFMYHGAIKSNVPMSLEEAARIDGCNKYQTFFKIVFPLLKTTTSTVIILDALWLWNDYLLPSLVLRQKDLFTLPLSTYRFYGTYSQDLGLIMAALIMTVAPILVLYLFLQKYIISGVVSGAVKS